MKLKQNRRAHISLQSVRKVQEGTERKRDVMESCRIAYRTLCERVKDA